MIHVLCIKFTSHVLYVHQLMWMTIHFYVGSVRLNVSVVLPVTY